MKSQESRWGSPNLIIFELNFTFNKFTKLHKKNQQHSVLLNRYSCFVSGGGHVVSVEARCECVCAVDGEYTNIWLFVFAMSQQ